MSVKNLHSLINGRWFIHEQYGKALLPSLFNVLEGRSISIKEEEREPDTFISTMQIPLAVANTFDSASNSNPYVVLISLKDPIYKYDQECGPRGTKSKMRAMDSYRDDVNCKGIVLDIDSGGGQVSGTPEFYDFIKNYSKPVVAYTDGYMCSAAYYIASAANHIVANKRTDNIGSIGVMVHFIDVTGIYEKQGAKIITEYATASTEKNLAFEELLKGNPELYIKNELDPIAEEFIKDIKSVRPDVSEEAFAGGTWNAEQSLERNLIDEIGSLQTAIDKVFELASTSINQNSNTMSKNRPHLQAVLGLDAPLASTEENGSYLNLEQLDTVEAEYERLGTEASTATQALADATEAHTTAIATERGIVTSAETSVNAMLTASNLPVEGTLNEKLTALSAHVTDMNGKDGDSHTIVRTDGQGATEKTTTVGGIPVADALNN